MREPQKVKRALADVQRARAHPLLQVQELRQQLVQRLRLVLRQGLDVLVLPAPTGAVEFVLALQGGTRLGAAAAIAQSAAQGFDLTSTLSLLLGRGALTSIHLTGRHDS